MDNKNYVLVESFHKANVQDRLWYCMDTSDLNTLKTEQSLKFGDKVYVIKAKKVVILGNDDNWYDM